MLNDTLLEGPITQVDETELARLVDVAFDSMAQENWSAARVALCEAIALAPGYSQLHEALGTACYRMQDLSSAATAYAKAIELTPDNVELLAQAALVQMNSGSLDSARELLHRARILDASQPMVVELLARLGDSVSAHRPSAIETIDYAVARKQLSEVTPDEGLTVEIGSFSYVHGKRIRNPSGARTRLRIGKFCSIATELTVVGYDHCMDWVSMYPFLDPWHRQVWSGTDQIPHPAAPELGGNRDRGDIEIGNDVWIGCDVKIFKGVNIGDGAVIGACSLVNKDVPPYTVVAGVPARPLRRRFSDAHCDELLALAWWNWPESKLNQALPYLCSGRIEELREWHRSYVEKPLLPTALAVNAAPKATSDVGTQARAEIDRFISGARDMFKGVRPAPLAEIHLKNSRLLPSRRHILDYMPKGGMCAEIGTQTGHFAKGILQVLRPSKFHIYDLDFTPFDFAHFAPALDRGLVELHKGDSSSLLAAMPDGSFDFIYVDGDHAYEGVAKDLVQAARKIKHDGWIVCNDYTTYSPIEKMTYGVHRAVNELCINEGFEIIYMGLHCWGYHDVALRRIGVHQSI